MGESTKNTGKHEKRYENQKIRGKNIGESTKKKTWKNVKKHEKKNTEKCKGNMGEARKNMEKYGKGTKNQRKIWE